MKKVTYVALFLVDEFADGRNLAESIQNEEFEVFFASGCEYGARFPLKDKIADFLQLEKSQKDGFGVMSMNDFMDAFNNEAINESGSWISYVQVTIETQADQDLKDKGFQDFVTELNAQCEEWGYPHMNKHQLRVAYETYQSSQESDPNGIHVWVEDALYSIYDTEDKLNTIEYNGKKFPTRTFTVVIEDEGEERDITVSTQELKDELGDKVEEFESEEEDIDCSIYFYLQKGEINLSPEEICLKYLDTEIKFISEFK
jgi:hypothetical protein